MCSLQSIREDSIHDPEPYVFKPSFPHIPLTLRLYTLWFTPASVCLPHSLTVMISVPHYGSPGTTSQITLSLKCGVVGYTQRSRTELYLIGIKNTNKAGNTPTNCCWYHLMRSMWSQAPSEPRKMRGILVIIVFVVDDHEDSTAGSTGVRGS